MLKSPSLSFFKMAIFKSYDGAKKFWKMKGKQKLRRKGEGKGVMASAFLSEQLGFISITHAQLHEINARRAALGKGPLKHYIENEGKIYPSIHLFEYGKDREGYWGGDDMCEHTEELLDVHKFVYGDRVYICHCI